LDSNDDLEPKKVALDETDYSEDLKTLTMDCMAFKDASRLDAITIQQRGEEYLRTLDPTRPENILIGRKKGK
jgi:hypothetical protein